MSNPETIYLNHAGTSWPKPVPVQRAVQRTLEEDPSVWGQRFEEHHREVARFFGVPDPERLLPTPGCTSALALAVADLPWERGDRVLTSGLEHHALHRPLSALTERGVELVHLPRTSREPLVLDRLEEELKRGKVRLVACSHASNVTGELLPIESIVSLAKRADARVLVDGAQVAGWLDLDLRASGIDLYAFAGHKGLQAPWGIGALYVAPGLAMNTPAATCALPGAEGARSCAPMPGYCDGGSVDRIAFAGLAAAIRWLEEPERADRLARARRLTARLGEGLAEFLDVPPLGSREGESRMPTLAFALFEEPVDRLARALSARGVIASTGLQCAPLAHEILGTAPAGVLRLSVGMTTSEDHVDAVLEIARACRTKGSSD